MTAHDQCRENIHSSRFSAYIVAEDPYDFIGDLTFNTFLPSEGELSHRIHWKSYGYGWLRLLITAATIYFCHTRLRALEQKSWRSDRGDPWTSCFPISSHSIPPGFPKVTGFSKLNFGTNALRSWIFNVKNPEKETILSILMEGYVALDLKQTILDLNSAVADAADRWIDCKKWVLRFSDPSCGFARLVKKVLGCGKRYRTTLK